MSNRQVFTKNMKSGQMWMQTLTYRLIRGSGISIILDTNATSIYAVRQSINDIVVGTDFLTLEYSKITFNSMGYSNELLSSLEINACTATEGEFKLLCDSTKKSIVVFIDDTYASTILFI